jgi:hypothetical protein
MSNNTSVRTQQILDLIFPPALTPDVTEYEWANGPEEDPRAWYVKFQYQNRQGKSREWSVNLHEAVYFDFRNRYYMIIRGERNGPVCFRLDNCDRGQDLNLLMDVEGVFDIQQADPDCFPTEDTQDWMLKQGGF